MAALVHERPGGRARWKALVVVGAVVLGILGLQRLQSLLPHLGNPFHHTSVDRSQPAVLHALEDVSQYHAATANYSVVVDRSEGIDYVPSFLAGQHTVFVAVGSVPANVDFGRLDSSHVTVDGRNVTIHLPKPTLGAAVVDAQQSRVASRQRGVLDRVGSVFSDSPTSDRTLIVAAEQKLRATAVSDASIVERAEQNTTAMITGLLRPLGFRDVEVRYDATAPQ